MSSYCQRFQVVDGYLPGLQSSCLLKVRDFKLLIASWGPIVTSFYSQRFQAVYYFLGSNLHIFLQSEISRCVLLPGVQSSHLFIVRDFKLCITSWGPIFTSFYSQRFQDVYYFLGSNLHIFLQSEISSCVLLLGVQSSHLFIVRDFKMCIASRGPIFTFSYSQSFQVVDCFLGSNLHIFL